MAKAELTLWVGGALIEAAKEHPCEQDTTLSALLSEFLRGLANIPDGAEPSTSPERLTGTLPEEVSTDDYREGLIDKCLGNNE